MSESTLSPMTAPRSKDALIKESPFKLRILVQQLGGLSDDAQKMAWHSMQTPEARADYVLSLLQQWDAQNPGAARAGAPAPSAAPMNGATPHTPAMPPQQFQAPQAAPYPVAPMGAMPPMGGGMPPMGMAPQVAPVSPQAATAATAATAEASKPKRSPRTSADAAPAADLGVDVLALLTGIKTGNDAFQQKVLGILEEAAGSKASRVTLLETKFTELADALRQHNGYLQSQSQLQIWTIMMLLTFMQENMGLPPAEVLKAAIQDSAMFQKLVDQATGKV